METKSLDDLNKNPKNPRTISKADFESLKNSIIKFGDLSGVVFNVQTGQLAGGHQRIEAFKALPSDKKIIITQRYDSPNSVGTVALGYVDYNNEQYGYREVSWPAEFEAAANIAANRISGEFDIDLLAEITYQLSQLEDQSLLEATGQTQDEIDKLLDMVGANGENPEEDEAPEVDEVNPPVSKLGEIYQLGLHRLMCGDATDFGAVSDLMDGKQADMVFTDPPYGIEIVGDNGKVGTNNIAENRVYEKVEGDNSTETAKRFMDTCKALVMKKYIIWGGNYFTDFLPFSDGWLVWDKRGEMTSNNFADGEMAWCSFHTPVRIYKQLWNGMIREGEKENREHPTQKPVKMLSEIISDFTKREDVIYDGFGGSGSTLIASDKMGRICYMMELSPAYVDVIRKRYAKLIGDPELWVEATPCINKQESDNVETIPKSSDPQVATA